MVPGPQDGAESRASSAAFVDNLGAFFLGRFELCLADLFSHHQVRRPFFTLVCVSPPMASI